MRRLRTDRRRKERRRREEGTGSGAGAGAGSRSGSILGTGSGSDSKPLVGSEAAIRRSAWSALRRSRFRIPKSKS